MNLSVSSSPHITSSLTVRRIMLRVMIALTPVIIVAVCLFGFYVLIMLGVSVGVAVLSEYLFNKITNRPQSTGDCSAVVSGAIFALNLPVTAPLYLVVVGSAFAIVIVKMLFGGIGKNFANPAATARIFVTLAWASAMSAFVQPVDYSGGFSAFFSTMQYALNGAGVEAVTSATPLADNSISTLNLFLGNHAGSLGEVCALAILSGGIFLLVTRTIDFKIPLVTLASFSLFTLIFCGADKILPSLLSGAILFGAFFMATDYSSSPNSNVAIVIYSVGIGFLSVIIRVYGNYPEGVSFSILLMNILSPLLDLLIIPRAFGKRREVTK